MELFPQKCSVHILMSAVASESIFYPKSSNGCWVLSSFNDTIVCNRMSAVGGLFSATEFSVFLPGDVRISLNVPNDAISVR